MKVICIDDKGPSDFGYNDGYLKEGHIYTAHQCLFYEDCYLILEIPIDIRGCLISFRKRRFIPLSEIDETEFVRNYNKELV